jgi:hypothetical protein
MAVDDLDAASRDLYGLAPREFIAARNAKVAEARSEGNAKLAASLRRLHKPSVGAWLANHLARDHAGDVERLIEVGAGLRAANRELDGDQIRKASKAKASTIERLIQEAEMQAAQAGQPASKAALEELETTLDAAFSDEDSAERLRQGRLVVGLHYSGLGFGMQPETGKGFSQKEKKRTKRPSSDPGRAAARHQLKEANRAADEADADLAQVRRAAADADIKLRELRSAEARAVRRSNEAHKRVAAAQKKLGG